jgi:hypothetical protein
MYNLPIGTSGRKTLKEITKATLHYTLNRFKITQQILNVQVNSVVLISYPDDTSYVRL